MKKNYYSKIIDQIEKIRTNNNINWMDILRLAFDLILHPPKNNEKINRDDKKISKLLTKLGK